ncbi:DUF4148 domain-containing protein [Caballeronia arationis]|jgi:hypothetical protein|nr:DUF4148 domain-containing protein [Caballeronia arationis]
MRADENYGNLVRLLHCHGCRIPVASDPKGEIMQRTRITLVAMAAALGALNFAPVAMAQTADAGASATGQASKADQKAQKKASHQATKAKRTADLKEAEKNGYKPTGEEANYPQNVQGKSGQKAP